MVVFASTPVLSGLYVAIWTGLVSTSLNSILLAFFDQASVSSAWHTLVEGLRGWRPMKGPMTPQKELWGLGWDELTCWKERKRIKSMPALIRSHWIAHQASTFFIYTNSKRNRIALVARPAFERCSRERFCYDKQGWQNWCWLRLMLMARSRESDTASNQPFVSTWYAQEHFTFKS